MTSENVAEHSDVVGGSTAARIIQCPGSYRAIKSLGPLFRGESSVYADEGTALHDAVAAILLGKVGDDRDVIGQAFGRDGAKFTVTQAMFDNAVLPALEQFDEFDRLCAEEGGFDFLVEARCAFPDIYGAFGTADIVGRTDKRSVVWDWKFGAGVPVSALENSQLQFYAVAAAYTHPHLFENDPDWPVELVISQPRVDPDRPNRWSTTVGALRGFQRRLSASVTEALSDNPPRRDGPACRFCKARVGCSAKTDRVAAALRHAAAATKSPAPTSTSALLSSLPALLDIADEVEAWARGVRELAKRLAEEGHPIDGWQLEPLRSAGRGWVDEDVASAALTAAGIPKDLAFTEPALRSPAQIEALAPKLKERGIKMTKSAITTAIADLVEDKPSSGTKLARVAEGSTPALALTEKIAALKSAFQGV